MMNRSRAFLQDGPYTGALAEMDIRHIVRDQRIVMSIRTAARMDTKSVCQHAADTLFILAFFMPLYSVLSFLLQ